MTVIALALTRPPHTLLIEPTIRHALEEDLGRAGDITTDLIFPADKRITARLVARENGTIAGLIAAQCAFRLVDPEIHFEVEIPDGSKICKGNTVHHYQGFGPHHPHRRARRVEISPATSPASPRPRAHWWMRWRPFMGHISSAPAKPRPDSAC